MTPPHLPHRLVIACALAILAPSSIAAQGAPRCGGDEYRQMDFWVGSWEVLGPDGSVMGRSRVTPILEQCAIQEEWSGGDVRGTSLNMYDKPTGTWRQMWVDNFGVVLRMEGTWSNGRMVLTGDRVGSDGVTRKLRVTLSPETDGTVRQLQERSEDGGETWAVIFDGRYRRSS